MNGMHEAVLFGCGVCVGSGAVLAGLVVGVIVWAGQKARGKWGHHDGM